jgi:hypothetical protein
MDITSAEGMKNDVPYMLKALTRDSTVQLLLGDFV